MNHFLLLDRSDEKYFNRERTLKLLELYKIYKKKVGTYEVKSMKKLWELVGQEMSNHFKITISGSKCENRFKVLERCYKKVVDNNNATGRGRSRPFEFENEMDDIFHKKRNMRPIVLLSSESIFTEPPPQSGELDSVPCLSIEEDREVVIDQPSTSQPTVPQSAETSRNKRVPSCSYQKRNDILVELKNDLKSFYSRREQREEEKLEIARKKIEQKVLKNQLLSEYIELLKKKRISR
ncbi:uncharacterized protein LOC123322411 [Coccinella septempunctata]|uniref:uncharacterized protein LOC123322411 n=1 Tax=Coccinella septempunctata TaxID=41139 RepID=UPI001D062E13|nr:uncharacterized protein LOC123322411 [Coccinella septempunctata]